MHTTVSLCPRGQIIWTITKDPKCRVFAITEHFNTMKKFTGMVIGYLDNINY